LYLAFDDLLDSPFNNLGGIFHHRKLDDLTVHLHPRIESILQVIPYLASLSKEAITIFFKDLCYQSLVIEASSSDSLRGVCPLVQKGAAFQP
jgi:hypothetical protein